MTTIPRTPTVLLTVLLATPALAQWSTGKLSEPRYDVAAASAGQVAVFAGGGLWCCQYMPPAYFTTDRVDVFNASTGTWSVSKLSAPRDNIAATSVGSLLFFAGGLKDSTGHGWWEESDVVDVFDTSPGGVSAIKTSWSLTLPTAIGAQAATTIGSKALFTNGQHLDIYDCDQGTWSSDLLPSSSYWDWRAASVGSKALFTDGRVVHIFDEQVGLWSTTTLSAPRWRPSVAAVGTKVIIAGGYAQQPWATSDAVDIYDASTGIWTTAQLSEPRGVAAACAVGSKILIAGGGWGAGGNSSAVDVYDSADGSWSTSSLSMPRGRIGAIAIGTKAVFAGGDTVFSGYGVDAIDIYEDSIGATFCDPAVTNSTGNPASVAAQGYPGTVAQGYALLSASCLPPQSFGYFLTSDTHGFTPNPGGSQGHLCLSGEIGRFLTSPFLSGSDGFATLQIDLKEIPTPDSHTAIAAGETWNFQAWYRDHNPNPTSNFTDAVSVTFH